MVSSGKVTTVQIMSYPDHRSQSLYLIQLADPILTTEVIKTQQSRVNVVSSATNSSIAFQDAIAGAIVCKATRLVMFFRRILTYRLALYYLAAILIAALGLSAAGIVHQSVVSLAYSAVICLAVCLLVNWAFAYVFGADTNWESVCISAIIITLIISPVALTDFAGAGFLALVSAWAMAIEVPDHPPARNICSIPPVSAPPWWASACTAPSPGGWATMSGCCR